MWFSACWFACAALLDTASAAMIAGYPGFPISCKHFIPNPRYYYGRNYQPYPYYGYRTNNSQYRIAPVYRPRVVYVPQFTPYAWYNYNNFGEGTPSPNDYALTDTRVVPEQEVNHLRLPTTAPTTIPTTTEYPMEDTTFVDTTTTKKKPPFIFSPDKIIDTPTLQCPKGQKRGKNGICRTPWK